MGGVSGYFRLPLGEGKMLPLGGKRNKRSLLLIVGSDHEGFFPTPYLSTSELGSDSVENPTQVSNGPENKLKSTKKFIDCPWRLPRKTPPEKQH